MARRDSIHYAVKNALEKDGWLVTDDPLIVYLIGSKEKYFEIDLGAEDMIGAERAGQRIAVEIKTFSSSLLNSFHTALGQFLNYRSTLQEDENEQDRMLYIAIDESVYNQLLNIEFTKRRIAEHGIAFVVVNIENENIVTWHE